MLEAHPGARSDLLKTAGLMLGGGFLGVIFGITVGNPNPGGFLLFAAIAAVVMVGFVLARPFTGFKVLAASTFFLAVIAVTDNRYLNAFDLVIPILVLLAFFGRAARNVRADDALLVGREHDEIRRASQRFSRMVALYFLLTGLSLIPMVFRIGSHPAMNSAFILARTIEGAVVFPLGLWFLRSEARLRETCDAVIAGGVALAVVNFLQVVLLHTPRAGMAWVTNHLDWPVEGPNEAGTALVILIALILAFHSVRPRFRNFLFLGGAVLLLLFTFSRSGILALFIFVALSLRRIRGRYLLAGMALFGLGLLLVPYEFWYRMIRTVTFAKGSFEVYTFMIRVYGEIVTWRIFMDHWLFGIGYLGARYVSHNYSELKIADLWSENLYLETAAATGVIGLTVLLLCFVRLFQLGRAVRRSTPPGTLAHEMARVHTPLMAAIAIKNLVGTELVGVVSVAQVALWCVLMVRGGHLAVQRGASPPAPAEKFLR